MVLLSFDIEEFDMPFEYGGEISFEEQISISQTGLENILDLLQKHGVKATFFSTVIFAENSKDLIKRLLFEGHELASHTYYHSKFETADLKKSREKLEELFGIKITGLRMPRMKAVNAANVAGAGYIYNSSVNPTFLPGRYNNLKVPRTFFKECGVIQIPASVSPVLRIPLFWLSFHNFPQFFYCYLAKSALRKDKYLNIYFHPWEFADISDKKYKLSRLTTKNTCEKMIKMFDEFLSDLKTNGEVFSTFSNFIKTIEI